MEDGDFRVTGTGSAVGAFLEVRNAVTDSTGKVVPGATVLARGQVEPPVAPAINGTLRHPGAQRGRPGHQPRQDLRGPENGGQAGPFTVANG